MASKPATNKPVQAQQTESQPVRSQQQPQQTRSDDKSTEVKTDTPVFHETPKPQVSQQNVEKSAASSMTQIETKPLSADIKDKPVDVKPITTTTSNASEKPIAVKSEVIKEASNPAQQMD